jgi:GTP cyclohydrolase I
MFVEEVFRGRYVPMPAVTEFPNAERLNELMIVGPITVRSACSHHLCPILGQGVDRLLPNEHSNLIGLSKYARICRLGDEPPADPGRGGDHAGRRTAGARAPDGLAIVMEADHFCMHWRGVKDDDSAMTNSVMRGAFLKDANLRREFLSLLSKRLIMLVRLLYASRSSATEAEFTVILRQSRKHNAELGVTGLLCHSEGVFVQVLEGGRAAVNRLYNQIVTDPRHRDVTLLAYEEIAQRRFAGWSMGQVSLQRLNPALLLKYSEAVRLDPYGMSGAAVSALFEELVSEGVIVCS